MSAARGRKRSGQPVDQLEDDVVGLTVTALRGGGERARVVWRRALERADAQSTDDVRQVAAHEAGHAVVACLLGANVVHAVVAFKVELDGRFGIITGETLVSGPIGDQGAFCCGGFAGELLDGRDPARARWLNDLDAVHERFGMTYSVFDAVRRGRQLLESRWSAWDSVRLALLDRGYLNGDEVRRHVEAHPAATRRRRMG